MEVATKTEKVEKKAPAESVRQRIENYNANINASSEEINRLKTEQMKLLEQKKQMEILRNQEKLAAERAEALANEIKRLKEANDELKKELG